MSAAMTLTYLLSPVHSGLRAALVDFFVMITI